MSGTSLRVSERLLNKRYTVERILDRKVLENGKTEYLIAWKDYPGQDSWEPEENLVVTCATQIVEYEARLAAAAEKARLNEEAKKAREEEKQRKAEEKKRREEERKRKAEELAKKKEEDEAKGPSWVVEKILDEDESDVDGGKMYLVKWKGWKEPTWEPEENMDNCKALMAHFKNRKAPVLPKPSGMKVKKYVQKKKEAKDGEEVKYEVRAIVGERVEDGGHKEYLVAWVGYEKPTWESEKRMVDCDEALAEFRSRSLSARKPTESPPPTSQKKRGRPRKFSSTSTPLAAKKTKLDSDDPIAEYERLSLQKSLAIEAPPRRKRGRPRKENTTTTPTAAVKTAKTGAASEPRGQRGLRSGLRRSL